MEAGVFIWQPQAAVGLLLVATLLVWLRGEKARGSSCLTLFALAGAFTILATLFPWVGAGEILRQTYPILPPFGFSFQADLLSVSLALLFLFSGFVIALYIAAYPLKHDERRFKTAFLFIMACASGVVLAGDLLSLFLFFEAMSLAFFLLIIHNRTREAVAATYKFIYLTVGGSMCYFIALAIVFVQANSFAWTAGGFMSAASLSALAFWGFVAAFGMKAGMVPLHFWLAAAYGQAPPPAAALSSVIMMKTGAYGMARIFHHVFGLEMLSRQGWDILILILALFTILYGSFCAFAERDLLRRLAYSSMAQLGYILFGLALLNYAALVGGFFHFLAHGLMKGTMLLCAGAIVSKTGKRKIADLAGIAWQMPLTMACFSLAALTAVGLPPMNVFVVKWYLSLGALSAGQPLLILFLLASSLLNAAYYLPIVFRAYFGAENRDLHASLVWDRLPWPMTVGMLLFAAGCIVFSLGPVNLPLELTKRIATGFLY
ncbi:MAG: monovalent cation/H+ antiporter subunit D family protein [Dethiobacter sp.]|nr:monovalent cation/H+ antiporter subunit D family protein [Dethiobacter sp.]